MPGVEIKGLKLNINNVNRCSKAGRVVEELHVQQNRPVVTNIDQAVANDFDETGDAIASMIAVGGEAHQLVPFRDSARIGELKKMKLRIKDELTRLEGASD